MSRPRPAPIAEVHKAIAYCRARWQHYQAEGRREIADFWAAMHNELREELRSRKA